MAKIGVLKHKFKKNVRGFKLMVYESVKGCINNHQNTKTSPSKNMNDSVRENEHIFSRLLEV